MIELWQFRASPYNEKVRWALDLKRVPHSRRSVLPGPHVPSIRSRSGQTGTPILKLGDAWLSGSAAILAELDARHPDPPLIPKNPAQRAKALRIQTLFDDDLGPRMRRAAFGQLLTAPSYAGRVFGAGRPAWSQAAYGALIPVLAPLIRAGNGVTGPDSIADGERAIEEAQAFILKNVGKSGYLVGNTFSIADLTAAAMMAMVCDFAGTPMAKPTPTPTEILRWQNRNTEHPAAEWARGVYARHRMASEDFDGPSPHAA
jgi:glutathione S-transferase